MSDQENVWIAERRAYMPVVRADGETVNEFVAEAEPDLATVSYTREGAVLRAYEGSRGSSEWAKRNPVVRVSEYQLVLVKTGEVISGD